MKKLFIIVFIIISMVVCTYTVHSEINNNERIVANNDVDIMLDYERFLIITEEVSKAIEEERKIIQEQIDIKQSEIDSIIASNTRKNNVTFNSNDLTEISGITGSELYNVLQGFSGGSLAEFAWVIVDCETRYNVNAFFLTALIAHEGGWGKSARSNYQNNLTGYAVYSDTAAGTTFSSKEECIYKTAELIANQYLNQNGSYYNGVSLRAVNTRYCLMKDRKTTDYGWSVSISSIANAFNQYYHNTVKQLDTVPSIDINMEELLDIKRKELISKITPKQYKVID